MGTQLCSDVKWTLKGEKVCLWEGLSFVLLEISDFGEHEQDLGGGSSILQHSPQWVVSLPYGTSASGKNGHCVEPSGWKLVLGDWKGIYLDVSFAHCWYPLNWLYEVVTWNAFQLTGESWQKVISGISSLFKAFEVDQSCLGELRYCWYMVNISIPQVS